MLLCDFSLNKSNLFCYLKKKISNLKEFKEVYKKQINDRAPL